MKFRDDFWIVFLPFHVLGLIGLFYFNYWFFIFWFFICVIGNGVAGHRYFAHRQFETYKPIKYILAILTSLGGVGPIMQWRMHNYHHAHADKENDQHSPKFSSKFHVFYGYLIFDHQFNFMADKTMRRLIVEQLRDKFCVFFNKYHHRIIYTFSIMLALIDVNLLLMYCLAYCVDYFRMGAVNYWCHTSGYRNTETRDNSKNNFYVGYLGMGFGWHNNHHAHPRKLILTERWWEMDIEGYVGWLLSKDKFNDNSIKTRTP